MARVRTLTRDGIEYHIRFRSVWATVLTFGHDCITLGSTIHCRHSFITEKAHAHEYCHVLQYQRYGVHGFLFRYLAGFLTHGYAGHPLEVEAHDYAVRTVGTFSIIRERDA
jgi:hypothetical protein